MPAASSSAALAAESRPKERPAGDVAEFSYKILTGGKREYLPLPGVEELGRRTQGERRAEIRMLVSRMRRHQDRPARSR